MRTAVVVFIATLIAPAAVRGQAQAPADEFTLTAFILALRTPNTLINADGTPQTDDRPLLWYAVRNNTAIPYSVCTLASGGFGPTGVGMSGTNHCSHYWIVLPGETRLENGGVALSLPQDLDRQFGATLIVTGKPLGSMDNLGRWSLRWTGTYAEAIALGDKMKASRP